MKTILVEFFPPRAESVRDRKSLLLRNSLVSRFKM